MASVRMQILDYVETVKLAAVLAALGWATLLRDPEEAIGEDQMNAIALGTGGDLEPGSLTGGVETNVLEFEVGLVAVGADNATIRTALDDAFVAVSDALLDPNDIQLGGRAVDIRRGAMSPAFVGRSKSGARLVGVQSIGFQVIYWAREGDASSVGP